HAAASGLRSRLVRRSLVFRGVDYRRLGLSWCLLCGLVRYLFCLGLLSFRLLVGGTRGARLLPSGLLVSLLRTLLGALAGALLRLSLLLLFLLFSGLWGDVLLRSLLRGRSLRRRGLLRALLGGCLLSGGLLDRKGTRLNSSHVSIS